MTKETEKEFKFGLMKAAKATDTWIITGGLDQGVMRLVGDAVCEDLDAQDLTLLGISSREDADIRENANNTKLNPNHSAFIVLNGNGHHFTTEFHVELEKYMKSINIMNVLIVVEGGYFTLKGIAIALEAGIPIIVIKVKESFIFNHLNLIQIDFIEYW